MGQNCVVTVVCFSHVHFLTLGNQERFNLGHFHNGMGTRATGHSKTYGIDMPNFNCRIKWSKNGQNSGHVLLEDNLPLGHFCNWVKGYWTLRDLRDKF